MHFGFHLLQIHRPPGIIRREYDRLRFLGPLLIINAATCNGDGFDMQVVNQAQGQASRVTSLSGRGSNTKFTLVI